MCLCPCALAVQVEKGTFHLRVDTSTLVAVIAAKFTSVEMVRPGGVDMYGMRSMPSVRCSGVGYSGPEAAVGLAVVGYTGQRCDGTRRLRVHLS